MKPGPSTLAVCGCGMDKGRRDACERGGGRRAHMTGSGRSETDPEPGPADAGVETPGGASLRTRVTRGGAALIVRNVVFVILKVFGLVVITHILGPAAYGAYVPAYTIVQYVLLIGGFGIGVHLVRDEATEPRLLFGQANLFLCASALFFFTLGQALAAPIAGYLRLEGFEAAFRIALFAIPLNLLSVGPTAMLEKRFDFGKVAIVEIASQAAFYLVSAPLALLGYGPSALAIGLVCQWGSSLLLQLILVRYPFVFATSRASRRDFSRAMGSMTLVNAVWHSRGLVAPATLAPVVGAAVFGQVAIAIAIVETLNILRHIGWRIGISVLSRLQSDVDRFRRAVEEGTVILTLAACTMLLGFSVFGEWVLNIAFGPRWGLVMDIFPFVAAASFATTALTMHQAGLTVIRRANDLTAAVAVQLVVLAVVAQLLAPRFGVAGYGAAELASAATILLVPLLYMNRNGIVSVLTPLGWLTASVLASFWTQLGPWAFAPLAPAFLHPASLRLVHATVKTALESMMKGVRGQRAASPGA